MDTSPHVLITEDSQGQRDYVLTAAQYTIGRDSHCDIQIIAPAISKHHATLLKQTTADGSDYYRIIDGDNQGHLSGNGIWYQRQSVLQHHLLSGDQVTLAPGANLFYFCINADPNVELSSQLRSLRQSVTPCKTTPNLVIQDESGIRSIALTLDLYTIGRGSKCNIQLVSQLVSAHHATIRRWIQPNGTDAYRIIDGKLNGRSSGNGLMINGTKCLTHDLESGDEIILAPRVQLWYRQGVDETHSLQFSSGCVEYDESLAGLVVTPDHIWFSPDMVADLDDLET